MAVYFKPELIEVRTSNCMKCGRASYMKITPEGWGAYLNGAFIQDAFPDMSAALREQLKAGTHPECWDAMFGDLDD